MNAACVSGDCKRCTRELDVFIYMPLLFLGLIPRQDIVLKNPNKHVYGRALVSQFDNLHEVWVGIKSFGVKDTLGNHGHLLNFGTKLVFQLSPMLCSDNNYFSLAGT